MKIPCGWFRGAVPLTALVLGVLIAGCEGKPSQQKQAVAPAQRPHFSQKSNPGQAKWPVAKSTPEPAAEPSSLQPNSQAQAFEPGLRPTPPAAPVEKTSVAALLPPTYDSICAFLTGVYEKIAFAAIVPPTAKRLGPHVYFERIPQGDQRHVYVEATVCLREGQYGLEFLLCRKGTKDYESVLQTEADARIIHLGLQATGATPGSPVQFDPVFKSPTGTPIKISVRYAENGKIITRPAQDWVRDVKKKKAMASDWVFAGSVLATDSDAPNRKPIYLAAAEGGYISVANVPTAMLDLPFNSPTQLEGREFAPFTEQIPPVNTKVLLVLEPLLTGKKK